MNEEIHMGLIIVLSILYPVLVYMMYRKEYDIPQSPHKRNKELHQAHNQSKGVIRRGMEWEH